MGMPEKYKPAQGSKVSKPMTSTKVVQLSKNIDAGLTKTEVDTPNSVLGQSMFMPSAPPVAVTLKGAAP